MHKQILHKVFLLFLGLFALGLIVFKSSPVYAANPTTLNFQGKVVNSDGTNVSDGTYSFVFRLYNTSSPTMTTSCTSTASCAWQETQGTVTVTNGVFQVELGSVCSLTSSSCNNSAFVTANSGPINFSSNNALYLSLQFNGDTSGSNGGFMSPLVHLTSLPYAFYADNAGTLNGIAASGFIQNTTNTQTANFNVQSGNSANVTAVIQGASGQSVDILQIKADGISNPMFSVGNAGVITIQNSTNSANAFQIKNQDGSSLLNFDNTKSNLNNLVTNSSFESAVSNWSAVNGGTASQDASQHYENSKSLKIVTGTNASGGGVSYSTGGTFLSSSTTYTLSAFVKSDSDLLVNTFEMGRMDNGSTTTSCLTAQTLSNNDGWQKFSCTFTTATVSGNPAIYFKQTDAVSRNLYIDDVLLQTDTNADTNYRNSAIDLTGTVINGSVVLQNAVNSNYALQVQDASGNTVFNVDTNNLNLISNASFETNGAGWSAVSSGAIRRDSTKAYLGTYSLQVAISGAATGGTQFSLNPVVTQTSTTYVLSFYSTLGSGTAPTFQVTYSPNGSATTTCNPIGTISTGGWLRLSCSFSSATAPSTSGYMKIAQTNSNSSTWYIDAVQMEAGSTASTYNNGNISLNGTITSPITFKSSNSVTALQVQNASGTSLITGDTLNGQVILGQSSSLSGIIVFNNSAGTNTVSLASQASNPGSSFTLQLPTSLPGASNYCVVSTNLGVLSFSACGAGSTATVTLSPEFPGAVMTGDGSNNTGTMTSDYCSGSSLTRTVNSSVCDGATTTEHNYYSWTASATNDYDIWTQWQVPSDWASFSSVTFAAKVSTTTSDSVVVTIYKVGVSTSCGSATVNTASTWQTSSSISTAGCTISAGDKLMFGIKLTVGVTNDFARMGEIIITYNRK